MTDPLEPNYDADLNLPAGPSQDDRMWAVVAHLIPLLGALVPFAGNIILPLLVWLLKREQSAFIDDQGKEAVNFQITATIVMFVSALLMFVCIGFITTPIIFIVYIVMMILAAIQANSGIAYRYPYILRLVK